MGSGDSTGTLAAKGSDRKRRPKRGEDRDIQQVQGPKDSDDKPGRMNIAEVLQLDRTETLEGEWNGHKFTVSFYPARSTSPAVLQGIQEGINGFPMRLADALCVLLAEWSIDWNGEPFPPSKNNLSICPFEFCVYVAALATPAEKTEAANG